MRIDRFLYFVRLAKSRTLAQAILGEGRARIDGRRVTRPSDEVRPGSIVALALRGRVLVIEVLSIPARRGPAAEARTHYREIDEGGAAA